MTLQQALLFLHVAAGVATLGAMAFAYGAAKGKRVHRLAGRVFSVSMTIGLAAAFVLAVRDEDAFMVLVSLFSGYFVYTGYRLGTMRGREASTVDKAMWGLIAACGVGMLGFGAWLLARGETMGVVMLVGAAVAGGFAFLDRRHLGGWPVGRERIELHVVRMGGASIAALTALTVVNVRMEPEFVPWLVPGVVMTAVIGYWTRRVREGRTLAVRDPVASADSRRP